MTDKNLTVVSNIAYFIAGAACLQTSGPLAGLLFMTCLVLALGSAWFHSVADEIDSIRRVGALADEIGMYGVTLTLVGVALQIHGLLVLTLWLVAAALANRLNVYYTTGVLGAVIAGAMVWQGFLLETLLAVVIFGNGLVGRQMDQPSDSGVGHSLWHLTSAITIAYVFITLT